MLFFSVNRKMAVAPNRITDINLPCCQILWRWRAKEKKKVASTNKRKITNYKHVMIVLWAHFHANPETWWMVFLFCWDVGLLCAAYANIFTSTITYLMSINWPCHLQWFMPFAIWSLIWMFGCPVDIFFFFHEKSVS